MFLCTIVPVICGRLPRRSPRDREKKGGSGGPLQKELQEELEKNRSAAQKVSRKLNMDALDAEEIVEGTPQKDDKKRYTISYNNTRYRLAKTPYRIFTKTLSYFRKASGPAQGGKGKKRKPAVKFQARSPVKSQDGDRYTTAYKEHAIV